MLITLIIFFLVLSLLVFVHEAGHFFTAKFFGVQPREFGLGMPPRIVGFFKGADGKWHRTSKGSAEDEASGATGTVYSINWFPLGGFVNLGEEEDGGADPNHFSSQKIWKRALIISAGVFMNFILAAVLLSIGFMIGLPASSDSSDSSAQIRDVKVQVVEVLPNSPASASDVKAGDFILSINNNQFNNYSSLEKYLQDKSGQPLQYNFKRGGEEINKTIAPTKIDSGEVGIGVSVLEVGLVKYSPIRAIYEGFKYAAIYIYLIIIAVFQLIVSLFTGSGSAAAGVVGPIGIAAMTGQAARAGIAYLIQFTSLLSLNLAVINFLPLPALDGGRIIFLILEAIRRKPVKREWENTIHAIGFALLMLLVIAVTFKDIYGFSGGIISAVKNFFN